MTGQEIIDRIRELHAEDQTIYFSDGGNITMVESIEYESSEYWPDPTPKLIID